MVTLHHASGKKYVSHKEGSRVSLKVVNNRARNAGSGRRSDRRWGENEVGVVGT